jgi:flagellum-specific ATP synthase
VSRPTNRLKLLESDVRTAARTIPLIRTGGTIAAIAPGHFRVVGLSRDVRLGALVGVPQDGRTFIGEVVQVDQDGATIKPFDTHFAAPLGAAALRMPPLTLAPDPSWLGRVVNALGEPIDGGAPLTPGDRLMPTEADPPPPMKRARVRAPLRTGVRVFDLFTPLCVGQRVGIFAGSGVGKSTLLSMLAHSRSFDVVVVAMVGERGREVREFLDDALVENRDRSITVVSTSDESPMMRRLAPKTAMAIAEYFRDRGQSVLLIVDSVTRFAHAARDVALAAGEPPVARGYTPSVFSELPRLLERSGPGEDGKGAITAIFAVLVEGDDHSEPIADTIRGTLDGHIVLDRAIADQGRYPAVSVLGSVSRLAHHAWAPEQRELVSRLRAMIARFEDTRDLRLMGGYQSGRDPELDQAIALVPKIYDALRQAPTDPLSTDAFRELNTSIKQSRA